MAGDELGRVTLDFFLLRVDFLQIVQRNLAHMAHRLQAAVPAAALAVAVGNGGVPVGRAQRLRQHGLDAGHQLFHARDQALEVLVHRGEISSGFRSGSRR